MTMFTGRNGFAAFTAAALTMMMSLNSPPARAWWVFIDPANIAETLAIDLQQISSYEQQIQQYETQIQQYQNMLQNTLNAPFQLIQQARAVVNQLMTAINTLSALEAQFGSLLNCLNQFPNLASYKNNPCFQRTG